MTCLFGILGFGIIFFGMGVRYARREYVQRLDSVVRALQADPEVIEFFDEMSKKRGAGRCRS